MINRSLREIQTMVKGFGLDSTFDSMNIIGVSIDSRTLQAGNLYIPIIRIDNGHKYAKEALEKGAVAMLWQKDQPNPPERVPIIYVENTLLALQNLAIAYRNELNVKIIGVTGSNGKTTTKDMIYSIVSTTYKTQKTIGNYNGEYGLPLTILELEEDTEVAILEMGMSNSGEIMLLSTIARPEIAIITMIGVSHISTLGSKEAIAHAKLEILTGLHPEGAFIFNGDEALLNQGIADINLPDTLRIIHFGESIHNDYYPLDHYVSDTGIHFTSNEYQEYFIPMLGKHNILNALASIATANVLKINAENIKLGLLNLVVTDMRMQKIETDLGCTIINDAWNASPASMQAAVQTMIELRGYKRKILVLGDMLELGLNEIEYHKEIGTQILHSDFDYVFSIGRLSSHITDQLYNTFPTNHVQHFTNNDLLIESISNLIEENDVILFKASRGMKMEEVINKLM